MSREDSDAERERKREYQRQYYAANKVRMARRRRAWLKANPKQKAKNQASSVRWKKNNIERVRKKQREWKKAKYWKKKIEEWANTK